MIESARGSRIKDVPSSIRVSQIEGEILENNVTMKYQQIVSPVNGKIFDLKPRKPGYLADPSQPVLKIVPDGIDFCIHLCLFSLVPE